MDGKPLAGTQALAHDGNRWMGTGAQLVKTAPKLQALVYDILPSATVTT